MTEVTGSVRVREDDSSPGSPVGAATVLFEPTGARGRSLSTTTSASGRYSVEILPGDYLVAVEDADLGATATWRRVVNIAGDRPRTVNLVLPSATTRLNSLVSAFPGEMGVYALDLRSGREIALNADCPMYLASVSKIAIAVGCVDLMPEASEMSTTIDLSLRHHRDEGKALKYQDLGRSLSMAALLRTMISSSDTTATDVLCEHYGIADINARIDRLGIEGMQPLSSMIQLDRRRWWLRDRKSAFLPEFAFSLFQRHRITAWLAELGMDDPRPPTDLWEVYLAERRDQATPRAFGKLLEGIAQKSLLDTAWKHDILLDTVMAAGGPGRFRGIVDSTHRIDGKGGGHQDVRNQAGLVRDARTGDPVAVLLVFTQRGEFAVEDEATAFVTHAGDLTLQALGIDANLATVRARPGQLAFVSPRPGLSFEQGDVPLIRWISNGIAGPLTLALEGPDRTGVISNSATDDGEWHSFAFPERLASAATYRFSLRGTDANGVQVTARSPRFTIGGTLHVLRPSVGEALGYGTTPRIRWVSSGVEGRLRVRLLRNGRVVDTFSSNAIDDGEWHSWTVQDDLPAGRGYQIEVTSIDDPAITDRSGEFVIGGQIEVTAPKPGDVLEIGTQPQIRWRTRGVVGPLRIALLGRGSGPVQVITSRARDDGEWHSWEVPDVADGIGYRLTVADMAAPQIVGQSPLFQIGTCFEWLVPSVVQTPGSPWSPAARPHFFAYGRPTDLRWRRIGPPVGQLRIDLLRHGRTVDIFTRNANDDGEWHSWIPTEALPAGSTYQLRISGADRPASFGLSAHFSIGAHIQAHIDDLRVTPGDTPGLEWVSEGVTGDLTIHLLDWRGDEVNRITNRAINDGEWHSYTVPSGRRGWHRFRVRSNEQPGVHGYTEWFLIS